MAIVLKKKLSNSYNKFKYSIGFSPQVNSCRIVPQVAQIAGLTQARILLERFSEYVPWSNFWQFLANMFSCLLHPMMPVPRVFAKKHSLFIIFPYIVTLFGYLNAIYVICSSLTENDVTSENFIKEKNFYIFTKKIFFLKMQII